MSPHIFLEPLGQFRGYDYHGNHCYLHSPHLLGLLSQPLVLLLIMLLFLDVAITRFSYITMAIFLCLPTNGGRYRAGACPSVTDPCLAPPFPPLWGVYEYVDVNQFQLLWRLGSVSLLVV